MIFGIHLSFLLSSVSNISHEDARLGDYNVLRYERVAHRSSQPSVFISQRNVRLVWIIPNNNHVLVSAMLLKLVAELVEPIVFCGGAIQLVFVFINFKYDPSIMQNI